MGSLVQGEGPSRVNFVKFCDSSTSHHVCARILPEVALGGSPPPCGVVQHRTNQKDSFSVKNLCSSSCCGL